ncbi:MAG: hypothetical protein L0Y79_00330 [Chlorobi bacterium]|nr:hypothetical protein [Chlorobiota bacterium]MCI0716925.1 hypothetical protein [Chlorobiota bacterium]
MKKSIYFLFLISLFIGCSSYQPPKDYKVEKETTLSKSYDVVWQNVVDYFATHNTPIKTMDKGTGLIATDYNLTVTEALKYMDCGEAGNTLGAHQRIEGQSGNFNILLKKLDENTTKVTANVFFNSILTTYGDKGEILKSEKINCNSKGVLEKELISNISR